LLRKLSWLGLLVTLLSSLFIAPVGAAVLDQVRNDFKPASGYIIMQAGDEFLIDQDASNGTRTGDLYAVVEPGEKIIHPVTQEVLGTLDKVKGLLQVTRIKTGYSYVVPVGKTDNLARGEGVRRFDHIPTAFWDYTGRGEDFFNGLKAALPALDWQPYAVSQTERPSVPSPEVAGTTPLVFVLRKDGLAVHGPNFVELKTYPPPLEIAVNQLQEPQAVATTSPAPSPVLPVPVPVPAAAEDRPMATKTLSAAAPKGITIYPGFQSLGQLSEGALWADFVATSDGLLLATTDGSKIRVYRLRNNQLTTVASAEPRHPGKILTLAWWQPADGAPLYLAATLVVDENRAYSPAQEKTINGAVFVLKDSSLVSVQESLTYLLGTFDLDGDGTRETLLGQTFDREKVFGSSLRRLALKDGQLDSSSFDQPLPWQFPVTGGRFFDLTGDGKKEVIFVSNRVLFVYQGNKKIYESSRNMGGSVSSMNFSAYPGTNAELYTSVTFEVPPLVFDLDGDGQNEIIAVGSTGSSITGARTGPGIDSAGLVVLKYQNGQFQKGSLGDRQENPIQGLAMDHEGYYLVVTQPQGLMGVVGASQLLRIPRSQP